MYEKYGNSFEILFQKKYWPHIDGTGGFFITKIRKIAPLPRNEKDIKQSSNAELRIYRGNTAGWNIREDVTLYEHTGKILAVKQSPI